MCSGSRGICGNKFSEQISNEMLVILKKVMNDLCAQGTSNKIRVVKQFTFKAGKHVGCYAFIGCRKSPADNTSWKSIR